MGECKEVDDLRRAVEAKVAEAMAASGADAQKAITLDLAAVVLRATGVILAVAEESQVRHATLSIVAAAQITGMAAVQKEMDALKARAEAAEQRATKTEAERDAMRTYADNLNATANTALDELDGATNGRDRARQERDAALARAEKAEAERDALLAAAQDARDDAKRAADAPSPVLHRDTPHPEMDAEVEGSKGEAIVRCGPIATKVIPRKQTDSAEAWAARIKHLVDNLYLVRLYDDGCCTWDSRDGGDPPGAAPTPETRVGEAGTAPSPVLHRDTPHALFDSRAAGVEGSCRVVDAGPDDALMYHHAPRQPREAWLREAHHLAPHLDLVRLYDDGRCVWDSRDPNEPS